MLFIQDGNVLAGNMANHHAQRAGTKQKKKKKPQKEANFLGEDIAMADYTDKLRDLFRKLSIIAVNICAVAY